MSDMVADKVYKYLLENNIKLPEEAIVKAISGAVAGSEEYMTSVLDEAVDTSVDFVIDEYKESELDRVDPSTFKTKIRNDNKVYTINVIGDGLLQEAAVRSTKKLAFDCAETFLELYHNDFTEDGYLAIEINTMDQAKGIRSFTCELSEDLGMLYHLLNVWLDQEKHLDYLEEVR